MTDILEPLKFAIQYRRKRDAGAWRTMAAFDVQGPADWYLGLQSEVDGPWEYRLFDIEANTALTAGHGQKT